MRAAQIRELGSPPTLEEVAEPRRGEAETLLEVLATPLNPIDIAVGAGRFFAGHPEPPYIPGAETVGRVLESGIHAPGTIVYGGMEGMGLTRDGALAERVAVLDRGTVEVPEGLDPALAASLGIAGLAGWLPLAWRAPVRPGETVLVLGATGTLGLVAVQAARLLGAGRVVAAGRRRGGLTRALERGADAVVELGEHEDLAEAFRLACGGDGPSIVIDPLWGEPFVAALEAAAKGARIVQLGQSAGPTAQVASGLVRGKQIDILGFTNFAVPRDELHDAYRTLAGHAASGAIQIELERVPLAQVTEAWLRQSAGTDAKLVVCP